MLFSPSNRRKSCHRDRTATTLSSDRASTTLSSRPEEALCRRIGDLLLPLSLPVFPHAAPDIRDSPWLILLSSRTDDIAIKRESSDVSPGDKVSRELVVIIDKKQSKIAGRPNTLCQKTCISLIGFYIICLTCRTSV
jgi:hypothetical protein